MSIILEQVFQLLIFAAIGYALCKSKVADNKHSKLLSCLELYVFLPATTFTTFSTQFTPTYIKEKYMLIIVSTIILLFLAGISYPLSRLLSKDHYQRGLLQYSLTIPNYGYMGYALAGSVFGQEVLLNVMVFSLPLSVYIYTAGYCMLTKTKFSFKKLINPTNIALIIGAIVGLSELALPAVVNTVVEKAAGCMAPISMLLAGMVISEFNLVSLLRNKTSYMVVAMRLLVIPFVLASALQLLSLEEMIIPTLMIYAMPCGLNTIVFPKLVNENCETGASLAFISTLLSCVTIPLCLYVFC